MNNGLDINKIKELPKVELHCHLDCSMSYDLVKQLRQRITYEEYLHYYAAPKKCKNLAHYIKCVGHSLELLHTKEALKMTVQDYFQQLQKDNIIYAEIRYAPQLHLQNGLKVEEVIETVGEEVQKQIDRTGIKANLIHCTLRHYTEEQSMLAVKNVERYRGSIPVAGFDLAADEAGFPINNHVKAFKYAQEKGIPITAHAGEASGPQSVWETLKNFGTKRIGHGVRSIYDDELVEYLAENEIHLEICPSCNVQIDIFKEYKDHSIKELYERGVKVGVNTDGRTLVGISLNEEYKKLVDTFEWDAGNLLQVNLNAVDVAFINKDEKRELKSKLESDYKKI
ncbi:MAG: adenosine deaminase [Ignavibacteria bacterium]|jgi:adenosine deaminase